jgi:hypothetical protein
MKNKKGEKKDKFIIWNISNQYLTSGMDRAYCKTVLDCPTIHADTGRSNQNKG